MIKKSHKFCSILCMASIFFYILISSSLCFGASEAKGIEFDKDDGEYSIEVELEGGSGLFSGLEKPCFQTSSAPMMSLTELYP